jgi:osmotically-inducible protein OsmY
MVMTGWLAALCLVTGAASAQEGTGEQAGKKVDEAIERLREGAKDVAGRVREGFEEARRKVDRLNVAGRVYARLHWDKALQDASISVDVGKDGLATLHGTVPNEQAKAKAEQLANDTVGVERVVNEMNIQPPPSQ